MHKAITKWLEKPGPEKRSCEVDFTLIELAHALGKAKPGKAPGEDGVNAELLGHLGPIAKNKLLCLFNRTRHSGQVPKAWRPAIVVSTFKMGKSPKDIGSYRAISLTSTMCKTMERTVNARLYHLLKEGDLLDENQAGIRRYRSTTDQRVHFTQSVINVWQDRQHTVAVFVDLKQAYDKVWRPGSLLKLLRLGIGGKMFSWIRGFLEDRRIKTVNGVYSRSRSLPEGLPQGSALSCTLFLCYVNDLREYIQTQERLAFADDIVLWQALNGVRVGAELPLNSAEIREMANDSGEVEKGGGPSSYLQLQLLPGSWDRSAHPREGRPNSASGYGCAINGFPANHKWQ